MKKPEPIDPKTVRPGPIRHMSLPPEMLEHIKIIFDMIGPYIVTSLEQFEIDFMRDMHPEREVAMWCRIAEAWATYHEKFFDKLLSDDEEKELIAALASISFGVKDVKKLKVPANVGRRLLKCYDDLRKK